jgi:hypothetical protein
LVEVHAGFAVGWPAQLTLARESETLRPSNRFWVGAMISIRTAAILVAVAGAVSLPIAGANAQAAPQGMRMAQASQPDVTEPSAPRRVRRPSQRLNVYPSYDGVVPRYNPGPNAVRECNATYVQEYRPSGTVIVPRMSCYWRPG